MIKNNITFYSLLYFSEIDINPNLSKFHRKNKDNIYIHNALNLKYSLQKQNLKYVLLTNNKKKIQKEVGSEIEVKQIYFKKIFKKKIDFYSAHFKIDVFNYLSKQKQTSCLLDIDMLAINRFNKYLLYASKNNINLVYNLNKGKDKNLNKKILKTLKLCNDKEDNTHDWYGGEFLFGNSKFFKSIYKNIKLILPNYKKNLKNLHHIGDETLLNSSLQIIRKNNKIKFLETNNRKIVSRFWSINTIAKQKNINFHIKNFLIHLPGDKVFLSKIDIKTKNYNEIKMQYLRYYNSPKKRILEKIKKFLNF